MRSAALALAALLAAGPATAQLARGWPSFSARSFPIRRRARPRFEWSRSAAVSNDVPSVQLGRECASGLLDLLGRRLVIRSTLGDQAAGTVLYTLTRR